MTGTTALSQTDVNNAMAELKLLGEHHPGSQFSGVIVRYVSGLVTALEHADKQATELSNFKMLLTRAAESLTHGEPLELEALFKNELVSSLLATMFAGEFVRSGALNYNELNYQVPGFGGVIVTIQKEAGESPGERVSTLEGQLEQAMTRIAELETVSGGSPHVILTVPRSAETEQGWKVDPEFISRIQDEIGDDEECQCWEGTPSMEVVEAVLLAAAAIKQSA